MALHFRGISLKAIPQDPESCVKPWSYIYISFSYPFFPKLLGNEYVLDMTSKLTQYLGSSCNVLNTQPIFPSLNDIFAIWHRQFM